VLYRNNQIKLSRPLDRLNPLGFKLEFSIEAKIAITEFALNENHQGLPGYVHEGIIAILMDEGMGWISRYIAGVKSVTAKMDIEFHNLAPIYKPLIMVSRITKTTKRLLEETSRIESKDGILIAEGTCLQYIISLDKNFNNPIT
jgi:acyl-coenzyme A thioesterase PaaI-like protein